MKDHLGLEIGEARAYKWVPHGTAIPDDVKVVMKDSTRHHCEFAVMIELPDESKPRPRAKPKTRGRKG